MAKVSRQKPRAQIMVADGIGDMRNIEDQRFAKGDWPISFDIPHDDEQADRWSRYLSWSCRKRDWSVAGVGQLERTENSGTISIFSGAKSQLDVVWERKRAGPLRVKVRLGASSNLTLASAEQFFKEVNDNCHSAITEPIYLRGTLEYEGLAWRGELWLDDTIRLAPPSLQDETAVLGP